MIREFRYGGSACRCAAAQALAGCKSELAVNTLMLGLDDSEHFYRIECAKSLCGITQLDVQEKLFSILTDSAREPALRTEAANSLKGHLTVDMRTALGRHLEQGLEGAIYAVTALEGNADVWSEIELSYLLQSSDSDDSLKHACIKALNGNGAAISIEARCRVIREDSEDLAIAALESLSDLGALAVREAVFERMRDMPDGFQSEGALYLSRILQKDEFLIDAGVTALESGDTEESRYLAVALSGCHDSRVVSALEAGLSRESVAPACAFALGISHPGCREILGRALESEDELDARLAARAFTEFWTGAMC
jgi:hypothetical protein